MYLPRSSEGESAGFLPGEEKLDAEVAVKHVPETSIAALPKQGDSPNSQRRDSQLRSKIELGLLQELELSLPE